MRETNNDFTTDLQNCARFVLAFAVGWHCVEAEDNVVASFAVVVAAQRTANWLLKIYKKSV